MDGVFASWRGNVTHDLALNRDGHVGAQDGTVLWCTNSLRDGRLARMFTLQEVPRDFLDTCLCGGDLAHVFQRPCEAMQQTRRSDLLSTPTRVDPRLAPEACTPMASSFGCLRLATA